MMDATRKRDRPRRLTDSQRKKKRKELKKADGAEEFCWSSRLVIGTICGGFLTANQTKN